MQCGADDGDTWARAIVIGGRRGTGDRTRAWHTQFLVFVRRNGDDAPDDWYSPPLRRIRADGPPKAAMTRYCHVVRTRDTDCIKLACATGAQM